MDHLTRRYNATSIAELVPIRPAQVSPYRQLVIKEIDSPIRPRDPFNFADLIEVRLLALLINHPNIKQAGAYRIQEAARDTIGHQRPLSHPDFPPKARQIARQAGITDALDLERLRHIQKCLEYDTDATPTRWHFAADAANQTDTNIVIDPAINHLRPVIAGTDITIDAAERLHRFLPSDQAGQQLGVTPEQVRAATHIALLLSALPKLSTGWDYQHPINNANPTATLEDLIAQQGNYRWNRHHSDTKYHSEPNPFDRNSTTPPPIEPSPIELCEHKLHADHTVKSHSGPFFNPHLSDWMEALENAAPKVGDLTPGTIETIFSVTENMKVLITFQLAIDPNGFIVAEATADTIPPHPDQHLASVTMMLTARQPPVHKHIAAQLPASQYDNLTNISYEDWANEHCNYWATRMPRMPH